MIEIEGYLTKLPIRGKYVKVNCHFQEPKSVMGVAGPC